MSSCCEHGRAEGLHPQPELPHSDQMSIDEKITVAPEKVVIEFTQTDPV